VSAINPFSGYIAAGSQVERANASDKSRQIRRAQALSKNIAQRDDEMEHQVESADTVSPASGQDQRQGGQQEQRDEKKDDETPHVDIKA
jgi:hypothetical protein